jgi:hypothetical protein
VHAFTGEASFNIIGGLAECLGRFKDEQKHPEILQVMSSLAEKEVNPNCERVAQ